MQTVVGGREHLDLRRQSRQGRADLVGGVRNKSLHHGGSAGSGGT